MLHEAISHYLREVEATLGEIGDAYTELYEEEILASDRVNLRIRLRFYNGYLLELNESIRFKGEVRHLGYRYHFQDKEKNLVFRYDNTPHFPNLKNFPHHKHLKDEVIATDKPPFVRVIREARRQAK
jgi:Family of unknown function (DUF6516)